ncbi:hypothetical protein UABAM_04553 [Candidatus Uabimicrobium amorphum]|uniref:Uncharacterized protein n=1 Tax=Uabimicrobium amorphum TaxID=2596890 RepID=A0A5S9F4U2_UABAM|nr:hypothetical protein [Candidatus Uabimicrobium amorphum]BBM86167.1 hypothetical protein UABAM_04553 [Candidatus Uabimicrobium amorphum]
MKILFLFFLFPISLFADYYGPVKTVYKKIPTETYLGKKLFDGAQKNNTVTRKKVQLIPGFHTTQSRIRISRNIPTGISVSGISALYEKRSAKYKATAHFPDTTLDITNVCKWIVSHKSYGGIFQGNFEAKTVPYDIEIDIVAAFAVEGVVFEVKFPVKILKLGITSIQAGIDKEISGAIEKAEANGHKHIEVRGTNSFTSGTAPTTPHIFLGVKTEPISPDNRITGIAIVAGGKEIPISPGYKVVVDLNKGCGDGTAYVYLCIKTGGNNPIENLIAAKDAMGLPEPGYTRINLSTNFGCHQHIKESIQSPLREYHGQDIYIFVKGGNEILAIPYGNDEDYLHKNIEGYVNQKLEILKGEVEKAKETAQTIQRELQKIEKAVSNVVGYETNKWDKREEIYNHENEDGKGRWTVAWGREITETDLAEILVAIGIDIYGGGGNATLTKIEEIGIESFEKITTNTIETFSLYLEKTARQIADEMLNDIDNLVFDVMERFFKALVDGKDPDEAVRSFVNGKINSYGSIRIHVRAGVASYSGSNKLFGQTASKTFSWQPFVAIRVVRD